MVVARVGAKPDNEKDLEQIRIKLEEDEEFFWRN